ncbi:unnamed protein product [Pseudo-nitzschia multistriata]|uniref:Uncharacterized protein n=1 Tax=Pseudo-nitzschia multistriata TaxID=183589 RepID=A0A448Z0P1_9STRA|nr:unnamed protein product [Pseudo-nitzschia multistriata]
MSGYGSRRTSNAATRAEMIQAGQRSRPQPIHAPPRQPINTVPDESEPSYSYEEKSFLPLDEEDAIDTFHRQIGNFVGRPGRGRNFGSSLSSGASNTTYQPFGGRSDRESSRGFYGGDAIKGSSVPEKKSDNDQVGKSKGGGGNKFWRTTSREADSDKNTRTRDRTTLVGNGYTNEAVNDGGRKDERSHFNMIGKSRQSGGLFASARKHTKQAANRNGKVENHKLQPGEQFSRSNSSSSLNNGEARRKSKKLDEVRRLKADAQQQRGEDGAVVDNGYYHEVPTMGMQLSPINHNRNHIDSQKLATQSNLMTALEEEMSGDNCTTDNSYEYDGSHTFLHSKMESTVNGLPHGDIATTTSHKNGDTRNPAHASYQREPFQQQIAYTSPMSATGAAVAKLSAYPIHNKPSVDVDSRKNNSSSSTHQIYDPPISALLQQQKVLRGVPVHVHDNGDNRSTTSTMSDLSVNDSSTNHRQQIPSSAYGNIMLGRNNPHHLHHQQVHQQLQPIFRQHLQHYPHFSTGSAGPTYGTSYPTAPIRAGISSSQPYPIPRKSELEGSKTLGNSDSDEHKRRSSTENSQLGNRIAMLLYKCEATRFPFKKKLMLNQLQMTAADIPVKDLYGTVLGQSLYKLSLSGNRLSTIPRKLVTCLPTLKTMDLSQCQLHQLPEQWNLPKLTRLDLSHNRLTDFPEETMLEGLLELQELNMFGNEVSMIMIPHNPKLLSRLEILDLGYNNLAQLPEELDRLRSLKTLKVTNNCLGEIPMRVCNMELKTIDVSNNPVLQPPIETCERGIASMKRYYQCLSREEQSKLEALQSKTRYSKNKTKLKTPRGASSRRRHGGSGRRHLDDSSQSTASKSRSQKSQSSVSYNDRRTHTSDGKASAESRTSTVHESSSIASSKQSRVTELQNKTSLVTSTPPPDNSVDAKSALGPTLSSNSYIEHDEVTINKTLKVIFVGMAMAGKTSMIKRLIEGEDAVIPKRDERTIGVDIYDWDPAIDRRYEHIDNRILLQDKKLEELCPNANVRFSVWDFAGQHVYHATHELFFSPRALYVVVWDMGANNHAIEKRGKPLNNNADGDHVTAGSCSDSDDESESEKARRADRALERDIDEKVQFWVDCIQSSVPGAAILPVATFDDLFDNSDHDEAKRRCNILKERLEKHEERRIKGITDRLKEYMDANGANDAPALRLRKLLGSYARPKIIFGDNGEDSIVRVSGTKYTGFAKLTEKINNIATGRETLKSEYPLFRGHVGARIPRLRLKVLDVVRETRAKFKVVQWDYFFRQIQKKGNIDADHVSDALHFLTNIGELSYFGDAVSENPRDNGVMKSETFCGGPVPCGQDIDDGAIDDGDTISIIPSDKSKNDSPLSNQSGDALSSGNYQTSASLAQFVFLNPKWLVKAVACILCHNLDQKIEETRRSLSMKQEIITRPNSFNEAHMTCPVITSNDVCMLWQAQKSTREAAERLEDESAGIKLKPFQFLQLLLVRFRVFIPIDLGIEKAILGRIDYSQKSNKAAQTTPEAITRGAISSPGNQSAKDVWQSTYFFLPSLLGPGEPTEETWTYKSSDSWIATLCHSVMFPDGVPPGLMERFTATVLSKLYIMAQKKVPDTVEYSLNAISNGRKNSHSSAGNILVKEVLCWRNAFLVKLGMQVLSPTGEPRVSNVEIFTALVDKDSNYCVGSEQMSVGSRRLITSGKGQVGDGGKKIWSGGYFNVLETLFDVMEEYGGLEFQKQAFCPECLVTKSVSQASCWGASVVQRAVQEGDTMIRCRHGHKVDLRLICPFASKNYKSDKYDNSKVQGEIQPDTFPTDALFKSVVVVGLWDGSKRGKIVRVGSGFIADKKLGLVVTASHTLMNISGEENTPFGENYFGMRQGKVVIGVIPRQRETEDSGEAVFRYFAKIVAKDPEIENGICRVDACVLCITTRMEADVGGTGEGCGDQIEHILVNNKEALKKEKLKSLKVTTDCYYDEIVRIIGYNQGGGGLMGPGVKLNRHIDFARGYTCSKHELSDDGNDDRRYKPRKEIVVNCATFVGHSGGPCVNLQGEVIGILSRGDPADNRRCYLVPTGEWLPLLKKSQKDYFVKPRK